MANAITMKVCSTCGHFQINHSNKMGCMVRGLCNYKFEHFCICDEFKEIAYETSGSKDNEVAGQALQ